MSPILVLTHLTDLRLPDGLAVEVRADLEGLSLPTAESILESCCVAILGNDVDWVAGAIRACEDAGVSRDRLLLGVPSGSLWHPIIARLHDVATFAVVDADLAALAPAATRLQERMGRALLDAETRLALEGGALALLGAPERAIERAHLAFAIAATLGLTMPQRQRAIRLALYYELAPRALSRQLDAILARSRNLWPIAALLRSRAVIGDARAWPNGSQIELIATDAADIALRCASPGELATALEAKSAALAPALRLQLSQAVTRCMTHAWAKPGNEGSP